MSEYVCFFICRDPPTLKGFPDPWTSFSTASSPSGKSQLQEAHGNHMLSQLGLPASNCDTLTLIHSTGEVLRFARRRAYKHKHLPLTWWAFLLIPPPSYFRSVLNVSSHHTAFFYTLSPLEACLSLRLRPNHDIIVLRLIRVATFQLSVHPMQNFVLVFDS